MVNQPLDWRGKTSEGVVASVIGSVVVLQANPRRKLATIQNDSASTMYLCKDDTAIVNRGIRLNPNGGVYEINLTNPYLGILSIACTVAAQNIMWTEDE